MSMRAFLITLALLFGAYKLVDRLAPSATASAEVRALVGPDRVVMLGASWCGYCRQLRTDLEQAGIPYVELDVDDDERGAQAYDRLSGRGVPITLVDSVVVRGYDPGRIIALARAETASATP